MRCPCCGREHAEETVEGSPFSIVVCPSMTPDNWLLVQDRPAPPTAKPLLDLMVVPPALAATAREIQRPPEWVKTVDFSRLFP